MGAIPPKLPVFVSYAHEDNESVDPAQRWLDRLLQMLKPLHLNNEVAAWSDRDLKIGDSWRAEIESAITDYAHAAVLLVSPAFLASDFIRTSELPALLQRHRSSGGSLLVIPVVLRHCLFSETRFRFPDPSSGPESLSLEVFQSANPPNSPLDSMARHEQDAILLGVAKRLREAHERHVGYSR